MQSLNAAHLIGRIGQEPTMRYLESGQCLTRLRLATDRPVRNGGTPQTVWHDIVCWGKTGEFAGEYLDKGRLVYIAGRIAYREYETADGERRHVTEIVASEIIPLDHRPARDVDDGAEEEDAHYTDESTALPSDPSDAEAGNDAAA